MATPANTQTTNPAPFVSDTDIQRIESMPAAELDRLPFGAIKLDRDGTILSFNAVEAELTGRRQDAVIGRNFFTEVAPCTNVKEFAGRFREGVDRGELHETFPYLFDFKMAPRRVNVTLFWSAATQSAWVFVWERTS